MVKLVCSFLLIIALLTPAAFASVSAPLTPEFTKSDYRNLRQSGRDLTFSTRSLWLPEEFRNNLLAVLRHLMNDEYSSEAMLAASLTDFYHGHILCDSPDSPDIQKQFDEVQKSEFETICKSKSLLINMKDAACLPKLRRALKNTEIRNGQILREILTLNKCEKLSVIYHTREYNRPDESVFSSEDAARNISVEFPNFKITHFEAPKTDLNSLPKLDLSLLLAQDEPVKKQSVNAMISHFGFFIDSTGVIHASIGSVYELNLGYGVVLPHP